MINRIEPRSGTAFELAKGDTLRIIDIDGQQVSDLLAFAKDDTHATCSANAPNGGSFKPIGYEELRA